MTNTVIDIKDAVVSFREDVALRGVSLEVNSGEFIGIIGPNGAGKTTILTVVNGIGKLLLLRVDAFCYSDNFFSRDIFNAFNKKRYQ